LPKNIDRTIAALLKKKQWEILNHLFAKPIGLL
jgi:hypothetical protein